MHKFLACDLVILTIDYLPEIGYNLDTIKEERKMIIAIIVLTALLSFQFVASIEKECGGLCVMFALEIILFAFIMNGVTF